MMLDRNFYASNREAERVIETLWTRERERHGTQKIDRSYRRKREGRMEESTNEGVKAGFPLLLSLIQYLLFG